MHLPVEAVCAPVYSRAAICKTSQMAEHGTHGKSQNKTQPTGASVAEFLAAVGNPVRRADGRRLVDLMSGATGEDAQMWGPTIVGFGRYRYKYDSGREGFSPAVGFSPRAGSLSLYGLAHGPDAAGLLGRLGKHRLGAGCLYINKLDDVDHAVLAALVRAGYRYAATVLDQSSRSSAASAPPG
jgi:hypothetical protein